MAAPHQFFGYEIAVRTFGGARGLRVVHPSGQLIPEHRHDWPLLTLPALGGYEEQCEEGVTEVSGPAVVLHPAGRCHANCIHGNGMETFSIEFDPAWVGISPASLDRTRYWIGGGVPLESRALVQIWTDSSSSEVAVQLATASFLGRALVTPISRLPRWLPLVRQQLMTTERATARSIAQSLNLNPRWLAHAYRQTVGEGLQDTLLRTRCEQAMHLLRSTPEPLADIAAASGFCDQSHLNRALRRLTGRTPAQIRAEREALNALFGNAQACSGERAPSAC